MDVEQCKFETSSTKISGNVLNLYSCRTLCQNSSQLLANATSASHKVDIYLIVMVTAKVNWSVTGEQEICCRRRLTACG